MLDNNSLVVQRDSSATSMHQQQQHTSSNTSPLGYGTVAYTNDTADDVENKKATEEQAESRWYCNPKLHLAFFIVMAIVSAILLILLPTIVDAVVREMIAIKNPQSPIFEFWLDPDKHGVKTHRKFFLYNITNTDEIASEGREPNIVVRGPFVYREVWRKDRASVRWYMNGTLGYKYEYRMFFEPSLSIDMVTGEMLSEDEVITLPNGPLRGTLYRVGRLPYVVVEDNIPNGTLPNITKPMVCMLLNLLVNSTVLGPKGIFVQRPAKEIIWGYIDPIWDELHTLLSLFQYNASSYFQAQWNGSQVVPSPYTFRSGQMCPLWQTPSRCNRSGNMLTLEVSGRSGDEVKSPLFDDDAASAEEDARLNALLPHWMQRPGRLLDGATTTADIVRFAGQLQGQWWWGPARDGMTGGSQPYPSVPLAAVRSVPAFDWGDSQLSSKSNALLSSEKQSSAATPPTTTSSSSKLNSPKTRVSGNFSLRSIFLEQRRSIASSVFTSSVSSSSASSASPIPEAACHRQYGTDGTRFPLPVTTNSVLQIFNDMMGRTFPFTFLRNTETEGISTMRFTMDAQNGLSDSAVNRYCYQQRMRGLINVSQFVFGDGLVSKGWYLDSCVLEDSNKKSDGSAVCVDAQMPASVSNDNTLGPGNNDDGFTGRDIPFNITLSTTPHGGGGGERMRLDEYLRKTIGGDTKSAAFREHYDSFADVVALTGTTLQATARGMISLVLGPTFIGRCNHLGNWSELSNFTKLLNMSTASFLRSTNFTHRFPRTLVPFLQLERTATIGGQVLDTLKSKLALVTAAYATLGVFVGVGVIGACVAGYVLWRQHQRGML